MANERRLKPHEKGGAITEDYGFIAVGTSALCASVRHLLPRNMDRGACPREFGPSRIRRYLSQAVRSARSGIYDCTRGCLQIWSRFRERADPPPLVLVNRRRDAGSPPAVGQDHCGRRNVVFASIKPPVRIGQDSAGRLGREHSSVTNLLVRESRCLRLRPTWVAAVQTPALAALRQQGPSPYLLGEHRFQPVQVAPEEWRLAHERFATEVLWFAHHQLLGAHEAEPLDSSLVAAWEAFERLNERFGVRIAKLLQSDCPVLINDYQLCRTPAHLRALRPNARILHMSYTAFASAEYWARLPRHVSRSVLLGMLAADILGFASQRWARNFVECVERAGLGTATGLARGARATVDHAHGRTHVTVYPAFVGVNETRSKAATPRAEAAARLARKGCRFLLARVDRLDPAKNALLGFEAFRRLLDRRPELRGEIRFAACLLPSRTGVRAYKQYSARVCGLVEEINSTYPGAIRLHVEDEHDRALGLLTECDGLLVNSVVDGMNLVAQEGALVNRRSAVLMLSATLGSTELLGEAAVVIHSPAEVASTVSALETAVDMTSAERSRRATAARSALLSAREPMLKQQLADLSGVRRGSLQGFRADV